MRKLRFALVLASLSTLALLALLVAACSGGGGGGDTPTVVETEEPEETPTADEPASEGTTIPDLSVRFEIPDPPEGDYAFILTGKYGAGGASLEGELPFTISAAP